MILHGITSIIVTPFSSNGDVDFFSLEKLIQNTLEKGVSSVTALGVAAEAHKLSQDEKQLVAKKVFEVIDGRCPIIVGTSANSTKEVIEATIWAQSLGSDALMIAPPYGWEYGLEMIEHYKQIAKNTLLPIVLQDYKEVTQVNLTPDNMFELCNEIPQINAIKLETTPTPDRIRATRLLAGNSISIVGGIGGVFFFEELEAGANGTMTGFAFPEHLVDIWTRFVTGDIIGSKKAYEDIRQVLEFEGQPKIGLAIRKEILKRRGWISNSDVRQQSPLDKKVLAKLDEVLDRVKL